MFGTFGDLIVVMLGFGAIVFFHELGHFLAARWAGIRVLAFSVGFGPALLCYRKGMGVSARSTERAYIDLLEKANGPASDARDEARRRLRDEVSSTEYRLSALPLGGYVKMLGQEDLHPDRTSAASDSFQNCTPWKRLVVISAGVVMNVILAAILFVIVFMVGLQAESSRIGEIDAGSPASIAQPIGSEGVEPGLRSGDLVTLAGDKPVRSFNDLNLAVVMASPGTPIELTVDRPGVSEPITFRVQPEINPATRLLQIGVTPASSTSVFDAPTPTDRADFTGVLESVGLGGIQPGMELVGVSGQPEPRWPTALADAARESDGEPITAEFADENERVAVEIQPIPAFETGFLATGPRTYRQTQHLLGLAGVMTVAQLGGTSSDAARELLREGDLFLRLGSVEYPTVLEGIAEVQTYAARTITASVERRTGESDGTAEVVELELPVSREGRIGFGVGDTSNTRALVGRPLELRSRPAPEAASTASSAADVFAMPGTSIVSIDGVATESLTDVWRVLRGRAIRAEPDSGMSVALELALPLPTEDGIAIVETRQWDVPAAEVDRLRALSWQLPFSLALFEPEMTLLRADDPLDAIGLGLAETKRVMITTYLTFARLFQGTVRIEHLKGPVGIAHLGTQIAKRGWIWVLFFLALISVNLAVINFLPLPIVDGGQFLMILYEMATGKPLPIGVQNIANLAGLVAIGAIFLIVTYNDIMGLFGG